MPERDDEASSQARSSDIESRQPDPRVGKYRPDPAQPATPMRTLRGFWGDSDRPGYRRLYLSASLDSYAEFQISDVLDAVDIPPDQTPFPGEQATRVTLRRDASVDITHSRPAGAIDPFDLDVRFGPRPIGLNWQNMSGPRLAGATPGDVTCETGNTDSTCYNMGTCCGMPSCVVYSCDCPPNAGWSVDQPCAWR
jgi:hypothetical protein